MFHWITEAEEATVFFDALDSLIGLDFEEDDDTSVNTKRNPSYSDPRIVDIQSKLSKTNRKKAVIRSSKVGLVGTVTVVIKLFVCICLQSILYNLKPRRIKLRKMYVCMFCFLVPYYENAGDPQGRVEFSYSVEVLDNNPSLFPHCLLFSSNDIVRQVLFSN